MSEIVARLEQRAMFKGRRCFAIGNDGKVSAIYSGPKLKQDFSLQVAGINPNVVGERRVAKDMAVGTGVFLLILVGFLWGAFKGRLWSDAFILCVGVAVCFLVPAGLCWREFVRRSYDVLIMSEPSTGNRLVILRSVPDSATVDSFVAALQSEIKKARESIQQSYAASSATLSGELERLAGLRDRGVLSDAEFQKAKTGLLGVGESARSIGFHS